MYSNINKICQKGRKKLIDKQKFPLSAEAVHQIENAMKELKQQLEAKKFALAQQKQDYKRNMAEKNAKMDSLNAAVAKVLQSVTTVVSHIDMVLEEDGSGNNNN